MSHVPIPGTELADEPYTRTAEVALGLTLYLTEPLVWAQQAAGQALDVFLQHAPSDSFEWYTTSLLPTWHRAGVIGAKQLATQLSIWQLAKPRHLFSFDLVDDTEVPTTAFSYREYDPSRGGPRASVLEITLPQLDDPKTLLRCAEAIAPVGPWVSGVGGYSARWNRFRKNTSFWTLYEWGRRYLGLELGDPEEMSWPAASALPGTNWLTMIGKPLAGSRNIDLALLAAHTWSHDVTVSPIAGGALIRAGKEPTVGDRNRLEYPAAYAEVARELAPHFVEEPPEFWGKFWREKNTKAWLRRFLEPDAWE
jgi:hypothetical protein